MNLNLYDKVEIPYDKTWIDTYYKRLYSREMPKYNAYTIMTRYNPRERCNDIFLALTNNMDNTHIWHSTMQTRSGILKINLAPYWHILNMTNKPREFEVNIEKVDEDEDGAIYYLDI